MKKRDLIFIAITIMVMITAHLIFENIYTNYRTHEIILNSETASIDLSDWNGEYSTYRGVVNFYNNVSVETFHEGIEPSVTANLPISWWNKTEYSGFSPYGFGLYEWTFTGLDPTLAYGLKFKDIETAYRVYVNDAKLLTVGQFATEAAMHKGNMGSAFVSFTPDSKGVAHVFVEVSNYSLHVGGLWNTVQIGLYDNILKNTLLIFFAEILLTAGTFTIMLLAIGFIVRDPRREALPLLALLSLMATINSLFSGNRLGYYLFPNISFALELRLEYLSGYLLFPLFVMLVNVFIRPKHKKILNRIFGSISVALAMICLFLPQDIYVNIWKTYMVVIFFLAISLLVVIIMAFKREIADKRLITVTIALCIIAIDVQYNFETAFSLVSIVAFIVIYLFSWLTVKQYAKDIQEKRYLQKKVTVDELTGLYNREYFIKELERLRLKEQEENGENFKESYLMFMDLDGLKAVNDGVSHLAGDQVIIETGRRIKFSVRSEDLVARYGGDEFLVLLQGVEKSVVEAIANRIISFINEPMQTNEGDFHLGMSIGIYQIDLGENVKDWIKHSDEAMYSSKRNGRNQLTFY